jgi:hypothetical protein
MRNTRWYKQIKGTAGYDAWGIRQWRVKDGEHEYKFKDKKHERAFNRNKRMMVRV